MKQLVLDIPEKDFDLFIQLAKRLKLKYKEADSDIPEGVKKMLDERLADKSSEFMTVDQLKKKIKRKYGF